MEIVFSRLGRDCFFLLSQRKMTAAQLVEMLGQLLVSLSSQDNKARKEAEKQLDEHWVVHQLASLLAGLAHLTASHPDAHVNF